MIIWIFPLYTLIYPQYINMHEAQALAVECLKWREIAKNEKNI